ncbi:MAG: hypothetical protein QGF46_04320 [Planctomycetota bacterium]|nr:hypothetical protein [Planctomycetota bacterium]
MSNRALTIGILLVVGACSRNEQPISSSELAIVESLAVVPPLANQSQFTLWGKYEVSVGEFLGDGALPRADLPMVNLNFNDANNWCLDRGLRLPNTTEVNHVLWLAHKKGLGVARNDIDLGINRSLPGGVFERASSDIGLFDLIGNVREWVVDENSASDSRAAVFGASFASYSNEDELILFLEKSDAAIDIGFRYVVNAKVFFEQLVAPKWSTLTNSQQRQFVEIIGQWNSVWRQGIAQGLDSTVVPQVVIDALRKE